MKIRKLQPGEAIERWLVFGQRGETLDTIVRCIHCERTYCLGDMRIIELDKPHFLTGDTTMQMCAYDDCDGDSVIDAI